MTTPKQRNFLCILILFLYLFSQITAQENSRDVPTRKIIPDIPETKGQVFIIRSFEIVNMKEVFNFYIGKRMTGDSLSKAFTEGKVLNIQDDYSWTIYYDWGREYFNFEENPPVTQVERYYDDRSALSDIHELMLNDIAGTPIVVHTKPVPVSNKSCSLFILDPGNYRVYTPWSTFMFVDLKVEPGKKYFVKASFGIPSYSLQQVEAVEVRRNITDCDLFHWNKETDGWSE